MKTCRNCHVKIVDPTQVCPLCKTVLESDTKEIDEQRQMPMYPDVKATAKTLNFVVRLYTFLAIVVEAVLIYINYRTYAGLLWSAISGIAIIYFFITLRFSIQKNSGYRRVLVTQVLVAAILSVGVDFIVGYRGWSVNFVLPGAVLLMDLAIVVLMLINMANWQSYILLQIMNVVFGVVLLIFWWVGWIIYPFISVIAAAVSVFLFVGTVIFGDRTAKNELKRRFHV